MYNRLQAHLQQELADIRKPDFTNTKESLPRPKGQKLRLAPEQKY